MDEVERQLVDEVSRNGSAWVDPMDDGEYEAAQRLEKQGYTLRLCGKALLLEKRQESPPEPSVVGVVDGKDGSVLIDVPEWVSRLAVDVPDLRYVQVATKDRVATYVVERPGFFAKKLDKTIPEKGLREILSARRTWCTDEILNLIQQYGGFPDV